MEVAHAFKVIGRWARIDFLSLAKSPLDRAPHRHTVNVSRCQYAGCAVVAIHLPNADRLAFADNRIDHLPPPSAKSTVIVNGSLAKRKQGMWQTSFVV